MQTRYCEENSVRLSVRPSVCHTRVAEHLVIISTSAIDCLGRFVSEMTYYVSSGTLNLTKPKPCLKCGRFQRNMAIDISNLNVVSENLCTHFDESLQSSKRD